MGADESAIAPDSVTVWEAAGLCEVARCEIVLSALGPAVLVWWGSEIMVAETDATLDAAMGRAAVFRAAIAAQGCCT
jgi:hypothetical protein